MRKETQARLHTTNIIGCDGACQLGSPTRTARLYPFSPGTEAWNRSTRALWNWFQAQRAPWFDQLILAVSLLGTPGVLAVVTLFAMLFLIWKRRPVTAAVVGATFGLSFLLIGPVRMLVSRERPEVAYHSLEAPVSPYSFPSEHTWLATATYLIVALAVADMLSRPRARWAVIGVALMLALAVGVSRLFVGLCYPSDVFAGWLAGFCMATFLRSAANWSTQRKQV